MTVTVTRLAWTEQTLGTVPFPKQPLIIRSGFGSGLARRQGDPDGHIWAIGDRGPNIKFKDAIKIYGWTPPDHAAQLDGAKLMPRPDIGPAIAQLRVTGDRIEVVRTIRLSRLSGEPVSGLPVPETGHADCEPTFGLDGEALLPDPYGMDTEGLVALRDGSFWAGEEYGPSLVRVDADGRVMLRLVPEGITLDGTHYPVDARLPAVAARRHLNRGFEALTISPAEDYLFLAFQSPLAHPDEEASRSARHVRIWQLDPGGSVLRQYLYRLDDPDSFRRDRRAGKLDRSDIKVCELLALSEHELLVLERASETTKIYRIMLDEALCLSDEHLSLETRPCVEELSCDDADLPAVSKELLFSSDDHPEVTSDMEGMALLDDRTLLIVSDNDFGVEEKETAFFRLSFDQPLLRQRSAVRGS
jgi:hypothetical protein